MIEPGHTETMLETRCLTKVFFWRGSRTIEALRDVNVVVKQHAYVLLTGPSGSGKTTLLSLLGGLDRPTQGTVHWKGHDTSMISEEEFCRVRRISIGFVFQNFNLLSRMSAWENVAMPLVPMGLRSKERFRRAIEQLEKLGLGDRIHHSPEELSGGEQQRVSIARALVSNPELILADEPTSNIDEYSANTVRNILREVNKTGKTVLVSTHNPSAFTGVDLTLRIDKGRVVERS